MTVAGPLYVHIMLSRQTVNYEGVPGGGGAPILGHGDDPIFEIVDPIGSLFYASSQTDWHAHSAEK